MIFSNMKPMYRISTVLIFLLAVSSVHSQERYVPDIPDIQGYQTLICDFHLHTVFSDGLVWPTVRVDEAWVQGLDAIAITDHLEYLPHKEDIHTNYNRSWQIAKSYAKGKDLIVIAGTEITKEMPPGHFNALFIKDAAPILNEDFKKSIREAANQGAFIMWNHPGWKAQQPDTMKWWDEHTYLYEKGWLHGIEVVNYDEFYPGAVDWALDKGLSIMGSSDYHGAFTITDFSVETHRSLTLVFATERSEAGIRDALFNQRTCAFIDKRIIGEEGLLKALFMASVKVQRVKADAREYTLKNNSDLQFDLVIKNKVLDLPDRSVTLKPGFESILKLDPESRTDQIVVEVTNFITGMDEALTLDLFRLIPATENLVIQQ